MFGVRVAKGTDPERIQRTLRRGGAQVGHQRRGVPLGPVGPGAVNQTEFTIKRGTYVFTCFLPDSKGRPHVHAAA